MEAREAQRSGASEAPLSKRAVPLDDGALIGQARMAVDEVIEGLGSSRSSASPPGHPQPDREPAVGSGMRTRRVCRWPSGPVVERCAAATFLATEKSFCRIMGPSRLVDVGSDPGEAKSLPDRK